MIPTPTVAWRVGTWSELRACVVRPNVAKLFMGYPGTADLICARRGVPLANGRGGLAFIEGYPTQAVPAGTPNWIACLARLPDGRANA